MVGRNLANPTVMKSINSIFGSQQSMVCVFLSYTNEDRNAVTKIGEYIQNAGLDIYLDVYDDQLQKAVRSGDPTAITQSIEKGLSYCTHIMCIVSEDTIQSWWVPYEIGYGKKSDKLLSTLTLKHTVTIPSYLEITRLIKGTRGLNEYVKEISKNSQVLLEFASSYVANNPHTKTQHPLDNYLDWNA
jgi:hypothetical protein